MTRFRRAAATLLAAAGLAATAPGVALANHSQNSSFQDDQYLLYGGYQKMVNTLGTLERLGVQTVRVNVEWASIAPDPTSTTEPAGFNAANPAAYDGANWAPYDQLVQQAAIAGIKVQFNLTGPAPMWAVQGGAPTAKASTHWYPNATDFYQFAYAVGKRFSGSPGEQPAVTSWSIWNEPNQPGWLAPQWIKVGNAEVPESAKLYRGLVNDGFYGLIFAGHTTKTDTLLVGETAPEGNDRGGAYDAMTPLPFLEALYCVNSKFKRLTGTAATNLGCPTPGTDAWSKFVNANGALFTATGFAHHPYDFSHSPRYSLPDRTEAPLADISRLEKFLDSTLRTYGVHRKLPLYFTEFGYETNPPDPHKLISTAQQAAYLNESDYLSYGNPRVRQVGQFLLYDSPPNPAYTPSQYDYWNTFQSGLLYANGRAKPSLAAYRMPLWLPASTVKRGARVLIWGQVRPADRKPSQTVTLQWRATKGKYRTLVRAHTGANTGYYTARAKLPGSGYVRALWKSGGTTYYSRTQAVTVTR